MIKKIENLTREELEKVKNIIAEAFVSNELFHNWGPPEYRYNDVLTYMRIYVDFVYEAKELYGNEDLTGFIGLEDSRNAPIWPRLKMLLRMFVKMRPSRINSLMEYARQIDNSSVEYVKNRHFDVLMVCVDKEKQGQGIGRQLVEFAKNKADEAGIPLLFETDMKQYAEIYEHLGCKLCNTITASNGVTRYSLIYKGES
ncbi:MAG: GNAT family N-acetyltransferase [Erysipelotrichaceae bacterium]|nr:GNAT family N-acetyltransferase [Erysipelotrichaceae bacterium]